MNEYGALLECYWQCKAEIIGDILSECHKTWSGLELNMVIYGEVSATSYLSHYTARSSSSSSSSSSKR
jgi:hypothetical protein